MAAQARRGELKLSVRQRARRHKTRGIVDATPRTTLAHMVQHERISEQFGITPEDMMDTLVGLGKLQEGSLGWDDSIEEEGDEEERDPEIERVACLAPKERAVALKKLHRRKRELYFGSISPVECAAVMAHMNVADTTAYLATLTSVERGKILLKMSDDDQAEYLSYLQAMSPMEQVVALTNRSGHELATYLTGKNTVSRGSVLSTLTQEEHAAYLENLSPEEHAHVLADLPTRDQFTYLTALQPPLDCAKVLVHLAPAAQARYLWLLSAKDRAAMLRIHQDLAGGVSTADVRRMLQEAGGRLKMSSAERAALLDGMSAEEKEVYFKLLIADISIFPASERVLMLGSLSPEDRAALMAMVPPPEQALILADLSAEESTTMRDGIPWGIVGEWHWRIGGV